MTATRRLAAILAADIAGYSRLIGVDEGGTLQTLKAIRAELIDPTIAAHNGRLVKTMGDGLLVEFGSVVDALHCATEVQAGMAERNSTVPADKRIEFRIGINVGDIAVEHPALHLGDAAHSIDDAGEFREHAVAGGLDDPAMMLADLRIDEFGEMRLEAFVRAFLVRLHQARIAHHIGGEYRR